MWNGLPNPAAHRLPRALHNYQLGDYSSLLDVLPTDERLHVLTDLGLHTFTLDGARLWDFKLALKPMDLARLRRFPDGPLCILNGGQILCLGEDGRQLWTLSDLNYAASAPSQSSAGTLLVCGAEHYIALNSAGQRSWGNLSTVSLNPEPIAAVFSVGTDGVFRGFTGRGFSQSPCTFWQLAADGQVLCSAELSGVNDYPLSWWPVAQCLNPDGSSLVYAHGEWSCMSPRGAWSRLSRFDSQGKLLWDTEYGQAMETEFFNRDLPDWGGEYAYLLDHGTLRRVQMSDGQELSASAEATGRAIAFCFSGRQQLFTVSSNLGEYAGGIWRPNRRFQLVQFNPELSRSRIYNLPRRGLQRPYTSPSGLYLPGPGRLSEYEFPDLP